MVDNNNQLQEVFDELQAESLSAELIQDNKLHFQHNEAIYRVSAPNQKAISEANNLKNRIYFKLLQEKDENGNPAHMIEKNLVELLKESQGIDIEALSKEIEKFEGELTQSYLSLARLKDNDVTRINKYKKEIEDIKEKRIEQVLLKAEYLAPSIQNQANDAYYKYLTSVCTEKYSEVNNDGVWNNVWTGYDEYNQDNSNLTFIALGRLTELILNV